VYFLGRPVAALCPGRPPFTFGRGRDRTLQFGHNSANSKPDLHISRNAGSIHYDQGLWVVCNDSDSRPFDVIVRGVSNPLPPRTTGDLHSPRWAVSPPGLEIRIGAPSGRYLLSVRLESPRAPTARAPGPDDPSTVALNEPRDHERLLLAAKFLALPDPGEAVGNREAAEYASAARPHEVVTAKAVEDCVARWCRKLQELGVTGISGRDNVNQLGRQLLAWGLLRQEDRRLLLVQGG
jgi:hypothetical protein